MKQPKSRIHQYLYNVSRSFDRKAINPPMRLVKCIDPNLPKKWLATGFVPRPKNRLGWAIYYAIRRIAINPDDNPPTDYVQLADDIPDDLHEQWIYFGLIRKPKTPLGWFMYHFIHGLMMRYPLWPVIAFSLIHMKPKKRKLV